MSLRTARNKTADAIAEGKFIEAVLKRNGEKIDADIQKRMNQAAFKSSFWRNRDFSTNNNELIYVHLPQHRFIDMKTRQTVNGVIRKKKYNTHNRIMFGHANNIVRELSFGFTESVKRELLQLDGQLL